MSGYPDPSETGSELQLSTFTKWFDEISNQPAWRAKADREADYYDGNQLDSEILAAQKLLGIPSSIEPLIGPTIDAVLGMEVKSRSDWRVVPEIGGDEIALACNEKLNKAEKRSHADAACSEAYASQIKVGLGWVEVSRDPDPFNFPYRCESIHRNEIWWDWLAKKRDLTDARYLIRRKWLNVSQAKLMFPGKTDLLDTVGNGWAGIDLGQISEGGSSTDLAMSYTHERGWSIEEMEWLDTLNRRICLFEVWYRVWERVICLKAPDGRVIEYDPNNPNHVVVVANGLVTPVEAIVGRVRQAWFAGPHKLSDEPSPYKHRYFQYVPFWGKREDRTNVPYGIIRGMMYLQDEVNARISKMQWILSAVRVEKTDGVVKDMSDHELANEISRPDAIITLDANEMARPGARFDVSRDVQLNQQQYQRLVDAREGIRRTGGVFNAFSGNSEGQPDSGVALNTLVQQSIQTLADINDNFKDARAQVGDMLLSMILEDIGKNREEVRIKGDMVRDEMVVVLNEEVDGKLNNDVQRAKLKVEIEEVPSTSTFRAQQLQVVTAALKHMPPKYQAAIMPFMFALMDLPDRDQLIEAIKKVDEQMTPERLQEVIDQAVEEALLKAQIQLKQGDLEIKNRQVDLSERKVVLEEMAALKDEVFKGMQALKTSIEAGNIVAMNPASAIIGDRLIDAAQNLNERGQ